MPKSVRVGDVNGAGGVCNGPGATTVRINGRASAYPGLSVTAHPCCPNDGCGAHCGPNTGKGSSIVRVEGKPLLYVGSGDTCGHSRATGSSNVLVGI